MNVTQQLADALRELLVAVHYADPPKNYGTEDEPNICHEARIPVGFVEPAHRALTAYEASRAAPAEDAVERVARAIYASLTVGPWENLIPEMQDEWRNRARAALAAMQPRDEGPAFGPLDPAAMDLGTWEPSENAFDARGYLIRNVLEPVFPGITPLKDLAGVCTQVDHVVAAQRDAISKAYAILWGVVTDDRRLHSARHALLDALGGVGSTGQKLALERYAAQEPRS